VGMMMDEFGVLRCFGFGWLNKNHVAAAAA